MPLAQRRVKVLFAAGGTGGHLYPAFAIAERLHQRGDNVAFVGTRDRLEADLVPSAGYRFHAIAAHPLRRRLSLDLARTLWYNGVGIVQSMSVLRRERPDVVVATGGYVCVPLVVAAVLARVLSRRRPVIGLLERDTIIGVSDRVLAPLADEVWTPSTTGVPVRESLLQLPSRADAAAQLGLDATKKTLFAFGASQGARSINDVLIALACGGGIPRDWQLLLLTGDRDFERARDAIGDRAVVKAYLDDPAVAYAVADLVLCRAGASTLAELAALRLPAILVPYPYASEAHQAANAAAVAQTGAAVVIEDSQLAAGLGALLAEITVPQRLAQMRENAPPSRASATAAVVARIDALLSRT